MNEYELDRIVKAVAREFGVDPVHVLGKRRTQPLATARLAAYYVTRKVTMASFVDLGVYFGRTHSTLVIGYSKVRRWMRSDDERSRKIGSALKAGQDAKGSSGEH